MVKRFLVLSGILFFFLIGYSKEKPNVLVFLVDDLRPDLGCYGNELIQSPNIDKLASEGVVFNNAYCQEAICAPSRMSILTGLRPETFAIYDIFTKFKQTHPNAITLPQIFKENGYKTVSIGKVYHHGVDDQDSWSIYHGKENNTYHIAGNAELNAAFEAADVDDEAYKDGRAAQHAIETLHQLKDDNFMMFVGLSKPHLPFNAPKKYWDLYDKNDFQIPVKQAPVGAYSMALTNWGELRGYGNIPNEGVLSDSLTKELMNGYYACVSYIDAQVGKVMQTLEDLDLRENTMVVFMSDHGWKLGEYGAWCKHSNFDLDVRVPLIISRETSHTSRQSNIKSNAIVENVDVFPTLAEACGIKIPKREGKSLLSLTDDPEMDWSKVAYGLYPRGTKVMGVTCTDGEYRYTQWRDYDTQSLKSVELYPCDEDFSVRSVNLAGQEVYQTTEQKLEDLLLMQFPANRPSFKQTNMPDETILQTNEVKIKKPFEGQEFEFGASVKVEALVGDSIKKLALVADIDTLRTIENAPFIWGVDSLLDDKLFRLSPGSHVLQLLGYSADSITKISIAISIKEPPIEQSPFLETAFIIPGRIEAEDYDKGGEGIAYHDSDENNLSARYRTDGVDIVAEGTGFCIDNAINKEWQEYTIEVKEDGVFDIVIYYSSDRENGGARIGISLPDENKTLVANHSLLETYGWSNFMEETIASGINFTKGQHVVRTTVVQFGYYLDWIEFRTDGSNGSNNIQVSTVSVFPNPNSNGLFNMSEMCDYEVYSIQGRKVKSSKGRIIDLTNYPKGIYLLKMKGSFHKLVYE